MPPPIWVRCARTPPTQPRLLAIRSRRGRNPVTRREHVEQHASRPAQLLGIGEVMFNLSVKKIGSVAIVHCEGRIVRSDAAFRLRDAVTRQRDARVVVLDLSGVEALEGGGLGMLLFLQMDSKLDRN